MFIFFIHTQTGSKWYPLFIIIITNQIIFTLNDQCLDR
uniref:Uncharacterized protein n=1 Tax=Tetranychus urticae TaxID=32264 RepID=T1JXK0_TETUR